MKKRNLNKLVLSKTIIGRLYGGITDDDGGVDPPRESERKDCSDDRTRGCPSWNVAC